MNVSNPLPYINETLPHINNRSFSSVQSAKCKSRQCSQFRHWFSRANNPVLFGNQWRWAYCVFLSISKHCLNMSLGLSSSDLPIVPSIRLALLLPRVRSKFNIWRVGCNFIDRLRLFLRLYCISMKKTNRGTEQNKYESQNLIPSRFVFIFGLRIRGNS